MIFYRILFFKSFEKNNKPMSYQNTKKQAENTRTQKPS